MVRESARWYARSSPDVDDSWIGDHEEPQTGVSVQNLTDRDLSEVERILLVVPETALLAEGDLRLGEIALVLTTDVHLAALHGEHLGDSSVTDVMTFPYDTTEGVISGDIIISVDRAIEQAIDEGWALENELLFIAIHGMLHLCGWNDRTDAERRAMHQRQHDILGLVPRLT